MLPKVRSAMPAKLLSISQIRQITPLGLFLLLQLVFDPTPIPFTLALPDLSQPPTQVLVQPSDGLGRENDGFGMSISASSSSGSSSSSSPPTVVIGAPFEDLVGASYVFVRSGDDDEEWTQLQRLAVDGSEAFGSSVAVDGDLLVVGDPDLILEGTLWDPHGAAHVFYRDGSNEDGDGGPWRYVGRMTSPVSEDRRGEFGISVAVGPDGIFAIGEKSAGISGSHHNVGAVHVYSFSIDGNGGTPSWELVQTIYPPDPYQGPAFGSSVSLASDALAIGEPNRRTGEGWDIVSNVGRAYVYRRRTDGEDDPTSIFELDAVLAPETDDRKQYFGTSVALSEDGSTVVVGAEGDWLTQVRAGGAFAFDVTSDPPIRIPLVPDDGENVTEIARYGHSVAVNSDGSLVAVGAPGGMLQAGAAYLYSTESGDSADNLSTITAELEPLNLGHAVAFAAGEDGGGTTATTLMVTDPGDVPEKVHVYADARPGTDGSSETLDAASRSGGNAPATFGGGDDDSATTAVRSPSLLSLTWPACAAAAIAVVSLSL